MKISYTIPVCNEYKEIEYLLEYLTKYKRKQDEIVLLDRDWETLLRCKMELYNLFS